MFTEEMDHADESNRELGFYLMCQHC